jgi:hypothetical protein
VAGGDIHLNLRQAIDIFGFVMASETSGARSGAAGRASFAITQRAYSADVAYTNISPEFRNDLGFISRGNIGLVSWDAARHFRSTQPDARLRVLSFGTLGERFDDSSHSTLNSRRVRAYSRQSFADGGSSNANVDSNYERLLQPFQVSRDVAIAPGEYRFIQAIGGYTSNPSNALSFSADVTAGEFYSGTIRGLAGSLRWRLNTNLSTSTSIEANDVDLPEGAFDTQLARFRVDYSFSTRMFLNTFVQYNNATSSWLTNVRYRFMYRPLSDFYVVYNDVRTAGRLDQRTLAIKHTLMLAF